MNKAVHYHYWPAMKMKRVCNGKAKGDVTSQVDISGRIKAPNVLLEGSVAYPDKS